MTLILSGTNGLSDVDGSAATPAIRGTDANTGIFFPAADTIGFAEGGAEIARFDSSGNLGIGTSSPTGGANRVVDVYGSGSSAINFHNATSGTTATDGGVVGQYGSDLVLFNYEAGIIQFGTSNAERARIDSSGNLLVGGTTFDTGGFSGSAGGVNVFDATHPVVNVIESTGGTSFYLAKTTSACYISTADAQPILFQTSDLERMRIDSSGNLLVGQIGTGLQNSNSWDFNRNGQAYCNHISGTGNGTAYFLFALNASTIGSITQSGTTAVLYNTTSDYRLKENVQPLSGALARVASLKPCTYTWKSAPEETGEGFIAHELAEVCPQAVSGEKDAVNEDGSIKPQGIDTSFLVATLTAAIQELKALVDTQASTITQLQADVAALKAQ